MDPSHDGSLAYRICYIGGLWGFKGVEVRIRPWEPSQSGGSKLDKLGTRFAATLAPGGFGRPGEGPQLRRSAAFGWRQENLGKLA